MDHKSINKYEDNYPVDNDTVYSTGEVDQMTIRINFKDLLRNLQSQKFTICSYIRSLILLFPMLIWNIDYSVSLIRTFTTNQLGMPTQIPYYWSQ